MNNYTKQIQELNTFVKTALRPSEIEGVGLFAIKDIAKGQRLYADNMPRMYTLPYEEFKSLFPEVRKEIVARFPQVINGSAFGYPSTRLQAYINHSEDPNYDAINDVVLRDIKKGEEITEDYRKIQGAELVYSFLRK